MGLQFQIDLYSRSNLMTITAANNIFVFTIANNFVWFLFLLLSVRFAREWFALFLFCIGNNGRIEYSITAGDDNNDFVILSNGTIRTQHALDRETYSMYNLVVTARDCAKEPEKRLSSTVQVRTIYEPHFIYRLNKSLEAMWEKKGEVEKERFATNRVIKRKTLKATNLKR